MNESPQSKKLKERVDRDYDGMWTQEILKWIMAWIDIVSDKTIPPSTGSNPNGEEGSSVGL